MKALSVALVFCLVAGLVFAEVGVRYGIEAGAGVDKISLGDPKSKMLSEYGVADKVDPGTWDTAYWYYSLGLCFGVADGKIANIFVFGDYDKPTQEGLKVGDPRQMLLMLYGPPEKIDASTSSRTSYSYWSKGITFGVELVSDKVVSLYIRLPSTGPIAVEQQSWGKVKAMFR